MPQLSYKTLDRAPPVLHSVLKYRGFEEQDIENVDLVWSTSRLQPSVYKTAHKSVNHFPRTSDMTKKDTCLRMLRTMKATFKSTYNFFPDAFILPNEYTKFVKKHNESDKRIWIAKPSDASCGRKIFLFRGLDELCYDQQYVIQQYIENPLTIGGYKMDMRLYVLVTDFHPLTTYLYRNGIVRFATEKYDDPSTSDLSSLYRHLTNSSINKHSTSHVLDKDVIGAGAKWDLTRFKQWYKDHGSYEKLWHRIQKIINCTLLLLLDKVPTSTNVKAFELFGFDVMIDANYKPW